MKQFVLKKFEHLSLFLGWLVIYLGILFSVGLFVSDPLKATVIGNIIVLVFAGSYYISRVRQTPVKLRPMDVVIFLIITLLAWVGNQSMVILLKDLNVGNPLVLDVVHSPVYLVLAVLVAPVLEEVLFRGVFYHHLRSQWGIPVGVILSLLLFAGLHWNVYQFGAALLGGLVFTTVYEITRRLWLCISLHALMNGLSLVFSGVQVPDYWGTWYFTAGFWLVVIVLCLWLFGRKQPI